MTYRDRRTARADRLDQWAAKRAAKADAAYDHAKTMAGAIPLGQPILAGHYSQGRDERYRARIDSTYRRAFEHGDKAESMASRAAGIRAQLDTSIYDDDPDAIDRLRERLAEHEAERNRIKRYNASCRKGARDLSILTDDERADLLSIAKVAAFQLGKNGEFPGYKLSNLSGNIKRTRDRLARLEGEK